MKLKKLNCKFDDSMRLLTNIKKPLHLLVIKIYHTLGGLSINCSNACIQCMQCMYMNCVIKHALLSSIMNAAFMKTIWKRARDGKSM